LHALLWGVLALALVAIAVLFVRSRQSRSRLPEYFQVQPFTLTNQLGHPVGLGDLTGHVWVADIIFQRCAGPCPKMTEEMSKLQNLFPAEEPLRLVTLTTDPEHDTPEVLRTYAEKFEADPSRWHFLTGSKAQIRDLAANSLKLGSEEKDETQQQNENDLFIHSTVFVLIDQRGKVRGFHESLEPGFQEKIVADIKSLLNEKR
jgi:protein SCO1